MQKKRSYSLALLIALAAGAVAAMQQSNKVLYADPQCPGCTQTNFNWTSQPRPCLGWGNLVYESCTPPGGMSGQCVVAGVCGWTPTAPTTCAITGEIQDLGGIVITTWNATQQTSPSYSVYSSSCHGVQFGWSMIIHHNRTSSSPCQCSGGTTQEFVGSSTWQCG